MNRQKLLNFDNPKTPKGESLGYLTGVLYLAPGSLSGVNLCPKASAGCLAACLNTAGRGGFRSTQRARLKKTRFWLQDPVGFISRLKAEITAAQKRASRRGLKLAIRLNGTSDIVWERVSDIIQSFPGVQFYDYTKIYKRLLWPLPPNYDLTFSLSENNQSEAGWALSRGFRIAAVYPRGVSIPTYLDALTIDGDRSDARFLEPGGVIVLLRAKGRARRDTSGFVLNMTQLLAPNWR